MHLLAISLLTILAGTLLLAKFKKDMPGKFFAFVSWFFIVAGFILFIGFIAGGICKISHHGCPGQHNCQHEMMMKDCNHGMQGRSCCPPGMDKGGSCGPKGMDKGMCPQKPGCMESDSVMKSCPKHMSGDSAKIQVLKK
jgi:hypothetical protein